VFGPRARLTEMFMGPRDMIILDVERAGFSKMGRTTVLRERRTGLVDAVVGVGVGATSDRYHNDLLIDLAMALSGWR
jgi:hypothetical protein